jgi:sulfur carrier protein
VRVKIPPRRLAVIKVIANGKQKELSGEMSVSHFLEFSSVNPQYVVVELRGEIVHRQEYEDAIIHDGDQIEIVQIIGGG